MTDQSPKPKPKPKPPRLSREHVACVNLLQDNRAAEEAKVAGDTVLRVEQLSALCFTAEEIEVLLDLNEDELVDNEKLRVAHQLGYLRAQEQVRRAILANAKAGDAKGLDEYQGLQRERK